MGEQERKGFLLRTDDLHDLKEGEIFTDKETGKKYRVRKTLLPDYALSGPHGLGDPNDRTLRRIEADTVIPNRMNQQIEQVECRDSYLALVDCMRAQGAVRGLMTCKGALALFNDCKREKFIDPNFRERVTEDYLKERSEVRRTGKTLKERKLEEYREWRRQQQMIK